MAENDIWITNFLNNSEIVVGNRIDRDEDNWATLFARKPVEPESLPFNIYAEYKDQNLENLLEIFTGAAGVTISSSMAAVFRKYNLGGVELYPITFYRFDRKTPVNNKLYMLNYRDEYETVVLEQSTLRAPRITRHHPTPPPAPKHWYMDLSRFGAAPVTHLCGLLFESQGTFPTEC